MASMGIHPTLPKLTSLLSSNNNIKPNSIFSTNNRLMSITNTADYKYQEHALRASNFTSSPTQYPIERLTTDEDSSSSEETSVQKIDSWMQESVVEIVKNLKKAPLLVQIYNESDGGFKIHAEKAVHDEWPLMESDWRSGDVKSPDGLIFVEELEHDDEGVDFDEGVTRAWGIAVQGKGVGYGPACYLLKTNRVCGGIGLGFCTHFCLMRVRNFKDGAFQQFKDAFLLR